MRCVESFGFTLYVSSILLYCRLTHQPVVYHVGVPGAVVEGVEHDVGVAGVELVLVLLVHLHQVKVLHPAEDVKNSKIEFKS